MSTLPLSAPDADDSRPRQCPFGLPADYAFDARQSDGELVAAHSVIVLEMTDDRSMAARRLMSRLICGVAVGHGRMVVRFAIVDPLAHTLTKVCKA